MPQINDARDQFSDILNSFGGCYAPERSDQDYYIDWLTVDCDALQGHISTHGITTYSFTEASRIADKACRVLWMNPQRAQKYAPLKTLKTDMRPGWTFADLSARVAAIAREAVQ